MKVLGTWTEQAGLDGREFHSPDVELIAFRSTLPERKFVQMDQKFDYYIEPNIWYVASDRFIKFLLNNSVSPFCKTKAIETRAIEQADFQKMIEGVAADRAVGNDAFLDPKDRAKITLESDNEDEDQETTAPPGWPHKDMTAANLCHIAKNIKPQYEMTSWTDFVRARVETKAQWLCEWMVKNDLTEKDVPKYEG